MPFTLGEVLLIASLIVILASYAHSLDRYLHSPRSISACTIAPDGSAAVIFGAQGNWVIDLEEGARRFRLPGRNISAAFFPDGSKIVAGNRDGDFQILDAETGEILKSASVRDSVTVVGVAPTGKSVCGGTNLGVLYTWNFGGDPVGHWFEGQVEFLDIAMDDQGIVFRSQRWWHEGDFFMLATKVGPLTGPKEHTDRESGDPDASLDISLSTDGSRLAFCVASAVRLLDQKTLGKVGELPVLLPHSSVFSPDGLRLAVGRHGGAEIWDLESETKVATFEGHQGDVMAVAYSEIGKDLVTVGVDGVAIFWDIASGRPSRTLRGLIVGSPPTTWLYLAGVLVWTGFWFVSARRQAKGPVEERIAIGPLWLATVAVGFLIHGAALASMGGPPSQPWHGLLFQFLWMLALSISVLSIGMAVGCALFGPRARTTHLLMAALIAAAAMTYDLVLL